ncbi:MAG: beta-L-arabinofuranosidase domain-containing protein [Fimbriimonadaceae bacterium]
MRTRLTTLRLSEIRFRDAFWAAWQGSMADSGLPHQWRQCEETGRLENLRRCGRGESGGFQGLRFNDSDVYKLIEASAYATSVGKGDGVEAAVDAAISVIEGAQMPDGYINSFVQLTCPDMRWKSLNALHEMYCIGHLIEAGVAHHEATGDARLLEVGRRAADHVMSVFGPGKRPGYPDHQEIELAMVRLSDAVGDEKYARYAGRLIAARGSRPSPFEAELDDPEVVALTPGVKPLYVKDGGYDGAYAQDDLPLAKQTRAVGHAVRAVYFYSGAVDTLEDDLPTMSALATIWDGLVSKRMYVTGGIGSSGRNEGFTDDYDLPNMDAYAETCAAIGLVYWAWRMFLVHRQSRYVDVLERALYNAVLSGVSLECDRYFYDNPLESDGRHERAPWFTCACCPPNIARLVLSVSQYALARSSDAVYVALPLSGEYDCGCARLSVSGNYPWSGDYELRVDEADGLRVVALREPEWSQEVSVTVNGDAVSGRAEGGFFCVERAWAAGDVVKVAAPMGPEWVAPHPKLLSSAGRVALQRGPLVFCLEQNDLGTAPHHWSADLGAPFVKREHQDPRGSVTLDAAGFLDGGWGEALYSVATGDKAEARIATFVPYFRWANRGANAMQVWVRRSG